MSQACTQIAGLPILKPEDDHIPTYDLRNQKQLRVTQEERAVATWLSLSLCFKINSPSTKSTLRLGTLAIRVLTMRGRGLLLVEDLQEPLKRPWNGCSEMIPNSIYNDKSVLPIHCRNADQALSAK